MIPDRTLLECRILVVEDEFLLADDLQIELEKAGAVVLGPVSDVERALAFLAGGSLIDGATLDINLRGATSYPVAEELLRREVPFVFTTGYEWQFIPERYHHIALCHKPTRATEVRDAIGRKIKP